MECSNIWIRFVLEAYFELLLSCFIGFTLSSKITEEKTFADWVTIVSTYILAIPVFAFPFVVAYLTLFRSRSLIKAEKEKLHGKHQRILQDICHDLQH